MLASIGYFSFSFDEMIQISLLDYVYIRKIFVFHHHMFNYSKVRFAHVSKISPFISRKSIYDPGNNFYIV